MTDHARVVVVGGGVTGCSVLYHLVEKGWSDVVLCERTELTAGSTWHSAGHVILSGPVFRRRRFSRQRRLNGRRSTLGEPGDQLRNLSLS